MKVSLSWLKELVDYQITSDDLANQLSLSSIGVKQQTEDYLELDLTYNRGDLLSLRGVAYEVAAITNTPLRLLDQTPGDFVWVGQNLPKTPLQVESPKLCPVYCIAKIENLKVEQSNNTWVKKLSDSGIRSINNVADVTNLIMVEYGQPMHAFDAKCVKDETLVVRSAKKGERITTLDGKTRDLDTTDLLIADPLNALGIAGVMGGKDSEVSDQTTTILLEAAIFDPVNLRKTSKRHGLYSEASKRFQHGLSPLRLLQALDAAIKMYQSLGGKLTAIDLVGNFNQPKKTINLSIKKTNSLLGLMLDEQTIIDVLKKINFSVNKVGEDILEVQPPYFRMDINIEEDLIEEVARMYGYEKIEGAALVDDSPIQLDQSVPKFISGSETTEIVLRFIYDLKLKLKDLGLTEVQTYSFYSTAVLEVLGWSKEDLIKIANPISSETEYMRMDLWPNLLEVVGKNIRQGFKDIAIFEIGKIYFRNGKGKPEEKYRLSIALMNNTDNPLEELTAVNVPLKAVELDLTYFHPKRHTDGKGEVHLRLLNKLGIEKRIAIAEFQL